MRHFYTPSICNQMIGLIEFSEVRRRLKIYFLEAPYELSADTDIYESNTETSLSNFVHRIAR